MDGIDEGYGAAEIYRRQIIVEGDSVAAYGDMKMKDKEGKTVPYGYCDIYRFSGDKIAELRSFVVKTQSETQDERKAAA